MNIFVLDRDPVLAAQYHCDKHVVKMIVEAGQMASTISNGPYKPTHKNHPCTVWARQNQSNYLWLIDYGIALCDEYTYRYNKMHKTRDVIEQCATFSELPEGELTPFALAMPDECKTIDPVESYRTYYHTKERFAYWTKREVPSWWNPLNKADPTRVYQR